MWLKRELHQHRPVAPENSPAAPGAGVILVRLTLGSFFDLIFYWEGLGGKQGAAVQWGSWFKGVAMLKVNKQVWEIRWDLDWNDVKSNLHDLWILEKGAICLCLETSGTLAFVLWFVIEKDWGEQMCIRLDWNDIKCKIKIRGFLKKESCAYVWKLRAFLNVQSIWKLDLMPWANPDRICNVIPYREPLGGKRVQEVRWNLGWNMSSRTFIFRFWEKDPCAYVWRLLAPWRFVLMR